MRRVGRSLTAMGLRSQSRCARFASDGVLLTMVRRSDPVVPSARTRQRGFTLIELLVSVAIGLLTIAVALSALVVSRGISTSVSDVTQLQHQAAYAFRVMGLQVRQAGSVALDLAVNKSADDSGIRPEDPVVLTQLGFNAISDVIHGVDTPGTGEYKLSVGHSNYWEQNVAGNATKTLFRNCLGHGGGVGNALMGSAFVLKNGELKCATAGASGAQPIIRNVVDFQVAYLMQQPGVGSPKLLRVDATGVGGNWQDVYGVELCLELEGDESVGLPDTTRHENCEGRQAPYSGRLRMVFRTTFEIRSQGLFAG